MNKALSTVLICLLLIFGASDAKQVIRVPSVEAGNLITRVGDADAPALDPTEDYESGGNDWSPGCTDTNINQINTLGYVTGGCNVEADNISHPGTGAPLSGNESLFLSNSAHVRFYSIMPDVQTGYVGTEISLDNLSPPSAKTVLMMQDGNTNICYINLLTNGAFECWDQDNGGGPESPSGLSTNTKFYLKIYFNYTGGTSTCRCWYSTDGSTWEQISTDNTGSNNLEWDRVRLYGSGTIGSIFDNTHWSTDDFNY